MATDPRSASPSSAGEQARNFTIHDSLSDKHDSPPGGQLHQSTKDAGIEVSGLAPLSTSKLGNMQAQQYTNSTSCNKVDRCSDTSRVQEIQPDSMDALLAKLSAQQAVLAKQRAAASAASVMTSDGDKACQTSSGSSTLMTPVSDSPSTLNTLSNSRGDVKTRFEAVETLRLKKELDDAKTLIARQKQELEQSRMMKLTMDQAIDSPSEDTTSPLIGRLRNTTMGPSSLPIAARQSWAPAEDLRSEVNGFDSSSSIWNTRSTFQGALQNGSVFTQVPRGVNMRGIRNTTMPPMMMSPQDNEYSTPVSPRGNGRAFNSMYQLDRGFGPSQDHRRGSGLNIYGHGVAQIDHVNTGSPHPGSGHQSMSNFATGYQPQPIGTPLSPTAAEFQLSQASGNPWNPSAPVSPGQTYISPMEPLNYRRLLDRSVNCNWKYIVDKIVCNNDQQASIFLQQKLKVGTVEQKYDIIEAIVAQAYPLMVNRFGNFLVQRCFEHGTPEQVIAIANAIRGNTLGLSMDAFGCHVVQKAFDAVPEDYKAIMVHELLRRIPETVIHRYACHVWQKLFELRWSDSPPQIMKYVNEALRGMWHEVALGETGSLVVQNIFENCLEEDKRPCINEVIASIDIVSHGQFGNWCIQHICEHGLPADRGRAIDHVLRYATEYSTDQFASKVVEKCLKIGGTDFLQRYLDRVCEGRPDRPRIPLIDIASDQYGNYLIQFILGNASSQHREMVAGHIRKHMVSLRGSKFGSRVGMLCNNPAYSTHPSSGSGLPAMSQPNSRYSSAPVVARYGAAYR